MRKRLLSHHPRLAVEGLEARDVPAGSVTASVSGSVLTLTGDDQSNNIEMYKDATGKVVVTGTLGTNITLGNPASGSLTGTTLFTSTSADIKSVKAIMNGGSDSIANGVSTADFAFTGGFSYDAGDGDNSLTLTDNSAKIVLGSLTFKALDGTDSLLVDSNGTTGSEIGALSISLGDSGTSSSDVTLNTVAAKSISLTGGEGDEYLYLTAVTGILSNVPPVKATGGYGQVYIFAADSLLGAVTVAGKGSAGLSLENTATAPAMTTGKISVNGGFDGSDFQTIGDAVTTGDVSVKGAYAFVQTDADTVSTGATKISALGSLFADLGGKVDSLSVTGGIGGDQVVMQSTFVTTGAVTIKTGSGDDTVSVGGTMGKLSVATGAGSDSVGISAQVKDAATIKTEAGHDSVSIDAGTKFFSTLGVDQGSGDDAFLVASSAPDPVVTFAGKVTVKQGSGNDTLSLDLTTGPLVAKPVFSVAGNVFDGGLGFDDNGAINADNGVSATDSNVNFLNYEL